MARRATSVAREKASLVEDFHGAVVPILDTHALNIITRARCWLGFFATIDTTLLLIGALVGGFGANRETRGTLPIRVTSSLPTSGLDWIIFGAAGKQWYLRLQPAEQPEGQGGP